MRPRRPRSSTPERRLSSTCRTAGLDHPLLHLPTIAGINFSVTKHVLMLWLVSGFVFILLSWDRAALLEAVSARSLRLCQRPRVPGRVDPRFDRIAQRRQEMGQYVGAAAADVFLCSSCARTQVGLIPLFEVLGVLDHFVLHTAQGSFAKQVMHGGTTTTANFKRHRGARDRYLRRDYRRRLQGPTAFVTHWKNLVPGWRLEIRVSDPDSDRNHGDVRPPVRAHHASCGEHDPAATSPSWRSCRSCSCSPSCFGRAVAGIGVGLAVSIPLAVGISGLEILVVLIQAYVFTLLTAVFIGMAIHVHH